MTQSEAVIATLASLDQYPYHINQVVFVGSENIRVLHKKFSIKEPYQTENIPVTAIQKLTYSSGISPFHIAVGIGVTLLLLLIIVLMIVYWATYEGQTIKIGAILMALLFGLRWTFKSRAHRLIFHMKDGSELKWRSRSGDFTYKERAISNILEFATTKGLYDVPIIGESRS